LRYQQYPSAQTGVQVANAGVPEGAVFLQPQVVDGKVAQPNVRTADVDLVGVIYSEYIMSINPT
jgi:hypothetical protein